MEATLEEKDNLFSVMGNFSCLLGIGLLRKTNEIEYGSFVICLIYAYNLIELTDTQGHSIT
jgi:hypothetical protein